MNRVRSNRFPNTVKEVVHQKRGRVCQFSYYCDGKSDRMKDYKAMVTSYVIASVILDRELTIDLVDGADHYFNPNKVLPNWAASMLFIGRVGDHDFYKARK